MLSAVPWRNLLIPEMTKEPLIFHEASILSAAIPVAGNGVGLRPITNLKPKGLVEVGGQPVPDHLLWNSEQRDILISNDLMSGIGWTE